MPSLTDRRTPSPTFTSASDSQFYPYTGAHSQRALCPSTANKTTTFMPLVARKSTSRDDDDPSLALSDDGTTTSGSYSMVDNVGQSDHSKVVAMDAPVADCYV